MKLRFWRPEVKPIEDINELSRTMESPNGHVKSLVVDETTLAFGYREIVRGLLPKNIWPVLEGDPVYLLGFDGKELWAIDYQPDDNEDQTPQDCFEATCWEELQRILGVGTSMMEKITIGVFVGLTIAFLVVIFLLVPIAGGG